ncbi:unnamed protein product [Hyaloperonospora brassicae]|uniref:Bacterial transcriptional activator domain-containing protein n=1 Tax=Hyaloperonospora brassicae TaxID=162125 RepID=A0AAV0U2Z9_HYABA|nr:unnamed protein product [Hyaloperonospora brassicae]
MQSERSGLFDRQELQQQVDSSAPEALIVKKQICDAFCSLEPTQALANLRLVQQNKEAAEELLEETYRRLTEHCTEESFPSLEFRTATGKMLIEVERYEQACDVLEGVMQEDDENAELWFLVATCYRAMDDLPNALEFFEKCRRMLTKMKKELRHDFYLDDQLETAGDDSGDAKSVGQQDVEMKE